MKKTIQIEGMMCGHCTGRVETALGSLDGVTVVSVSVDDKNAVVDVTDAVTEALLKETIEDQGYDVITIQ